jgi:hypothetical protein
LKLQVARILAAEQESKRDPGRYTEHSLAIAEEGEIGRGQARVILVRISRDSCRRRDRREVMKYEAVALRGVSMWRREPQPELIHANYTKRNVVRGFPPREHRRYILRGAGGDDVESPTWVWGLERLPRLAVGEVL